MGASRIRKSYSTPKDVEAEFINAFLSLQDEKITIVNSTPSVNDMKQGERVIYSSGAHKQFLIRIDTQIYKVNLQLK